MGEREVRVADSSRPSPWRANDFFLPSCRQVPLIKTLVRLVLLVVKHFG